MTRTFFLLTVIALLISACSQQSGENSTPVLPPPPKPALTPSQIPPTPTEKPFCQSMSEIATSDPGIFPATTEFDHVRGSQDAKVTITLYTDFDCTGCMVAAKTADQLMIDFPDQIKVIVRYLPQATEKSPLAVQAAEAAGLQEKYWEMHDLLFDLQPTWTTLSTDEFKGWVIDQAESIGLDPARFESDFSSTELSGIPAMAYSNAVTALSSAGAEMMPLPLILINSEIYSGTPTYFGIKDMIALKLLISRQYTCPDVVIDPSRQYIATLKTSKGDIVILLYADKAPNTVNSFVFLARNGWFDGITFHRVIPGFVAQTGDPSGTGIGGPGYIFDNEQNGLTFDRPGLVAMANAGPNTNGSQFFITYTAQPALDGGYTVFGEVISGMDVAESLTPRIPEQDPSSPPGDTLITIIIEEK